jgi:hypothetical protein
MLEMKRRRFLQMIGAAGVAPAVPTMPARTAVTATGTHSQMLWAAMYKNANTGPKVVGLARTMGISTNATVGVYTKLVQANVLVARTAMNVGRTVRSASAINTAPVAKVAGRKTIKVDVVKFLTQDDDDQVQIDDSVDDENVEPGDI